MSHENIYAAIFGKLSDLQKIAPTVFTSEVPPSTLLTDLVAYWKMDEVSTGSSPVTREDSTSNNYHFTDINNCSSGTGRIGNACIAHESLNRYLQINDAPWMDRPNNSFSICGWIYPLDSASHYVMGKFAGAASGQEFMIFQINTGGNNFQYRFGFNDGGFSFNLLPTVAADLTNQWLCYGYIYDDDLGVYRGKLGVNGTIHSFTRSYGAPQKTTSHLRLGAGIGATLNFQGYVDETGYWDRALTDDEFEEFYNTGNGVTYPF